MKKYKVVYDRANCIAAGPCAVVAPDFFKISEDDAKADLVGGKDVGDQIFELIVEEKDLQKVKEAASVCPVVVIKVFDLETGEQVG